MIKVASYCRVSTDKDDQANSFETQKRYFREYIESHPDWELHEIYADEGIKMKRYMPRAKGRASGLVKRTSHINVVVAER